MAGLVWSGAAETAPDRGAWFLAGSTALFRVVGLGRHEVRKARSNKTLMFSSSWLMLSSPLTLLIEVFWIGS